MANSYFNENTLEELIEEIKYVYKSDDRPWVIGYSGGKDSTTVVELVYKMLLGLDPDDRHKNVYIVSSDTLIENPLIKIYLSKMNDLLGQAADRDGLPIKSAMVTPPPNNSFWANVIGRGFPTPRMNGTFRWCTDRLKINPSGEYIQRVIDEEGKEVVVLLGVRKAESIARKRRIEGRELANRLLNRHETIQDAYVYNPIVELTTDDVWDVLLRCDGGRTPWGSDNSELVSLYADADSGECPFAGRILSIVDFIDQEIYEEKVVVFTNYAETFEKYGQVLKAYFGEEKIALFNKNMNEEELELSIYRFQNDDECKILLCDETGGEGRNLQGADFVIHIDLPWDANAIEQRIGRLDRLGRPADKDVLS